MSQILGLIGGGGAGVADILGGIVGGSQAANALKDANSQLYQNALNQYNTDTTNLSPYMTAGGGYANQLLAMLPQLSQGFDPTQAQLQQTPGYQFALNQGLESTQNGFAAQGLGVSGAAIKGAQQYAEGLADQTYQQQADIYNQNRQTTDSILQGGANMGEGAASTLGELGNQNLLILQAALQGIGNAKAQGDMAPYQGISAGFSQIGGAAAASGGGSGIGSLLGSYMGGGFGL